MAQRDLGTKDGTGGAQDEKAAQPSVPPNIPPSPSIAHGVAEARSLFDRQILRQALIDSFKKLDPRVQVKNPVMFVVLVGTVVTFAESVAHPSLFDWSITAWLFLTVIFANFAEAMAEGRGKAQADTLRRMRSETEARRLRPDGTEERVPASALGKGDLVVCEAGDIIPSDGEITEGIASVDESAITGESAPVIRESGGDRSAGDRRDEGPFGPRRGPDHSGAGPDVPRPDDRSGRGGEPPKDPQGDRPHHPACRANHRLLAGCRRPATLRQVRGRASVGGHPGGAAGVPNPHHHRCTAVRHRHRRDGPVGATQRAGHERAGGGGGRRCTTLLLDKTGTITLGNRQASAFDPVGGHTEQELAATAQLASLADETPEGRSIVVLAKDRFGIRERELGPSPTFVPFSATTPNVRTQPRRPANPQRAPPSPSSDGSPKRAGPSRPNSTRIVERVAADRAARRWSWPTGRTSGRHRAQGRGQPGIPGQIRRDPPDGDPDRDDHGRQPPDGRRHRPGGRGG